MTTDEYIRYFMKEAIKEAKKCESVEGAYNVGCVITNQSEIISQGYSREIEANTHAEEVALMKIAKAMEKLKENNLDLFTTMEPCSKRLSGKISCLQHILNVKHLIHKVYVGVREPLHFVHCKGIDTLVEYGVNVVMIEELKEEIVSLNSHIK